jgi:PLP dependent protein
MTAASEPLLHRNVVQVRERIEQACRRAGRDPGEVTLVGVTKTHSVEAVTAAWDAGLRDFGENRAQEGCPKAGEVAARNLAARWHFLGHLQTNKVREVVRHFTVLHSLDSERLLAAIEREIASQVLPALEAFIEVNVAGEASKGGVAPIDLPRIVARVQASEHVHLRGLMTVAPRVADPGDVRPVFRELRQLAHSMHLHQLSMGMTEDFEVAIEEGATHIRIGRALFGERAE